VITQLYPNLYLRSFACLLSLFSYSVSSFERLFPFRRHSSLVSLLLFLSLAAIAWALGVVLRYVVLFPLRLLALICGFSIVGVCFPVVKILGHFINTSRMEIGLIQLLATAFVMSWSGVVRIHGIRPTPRPGQPAGVFVANHSSMIDFLILLQSHPYAVVGQHHPGWVGFFQDSLLRSLHCLWFNRGENKDRKIVADRISSHSHDPTKNHTPLLVFPEGTCVNNEYVVQFKKFVFELDVPINPIAIKYQKIFVDGYWNSREQSFLQHLIRLMTSWAVVVDVWFMDQQTRRPGEKPEEFASRVQKMIAARAGIKAVDWDGYLKYWKPSARFIEARNKAVAADILQGMGITDSPEGPEFASSSSSSSSAHGTKASDAASKATDGVAASTTSTAATGAAGTTGGPMKLATPTAEQKLLAAIAGAANTVTPPGTTGGAGGAASTEGVSSSGHTVAGDAVLARPSPTTSAAALPTTATARMHNQASSVSLGDAEAAASGDASHEDAEALQRQVDAAAAKHARYSTASYRVPTSAGGHSTHGATTTTMLVNTSSITPTSASSAFASAKTTPKSAAATGVSTATGRPPLLTTANSGIGGFPGVGGAGNVITGSSAISPTNSTTASALPAYLTSQAAANSPLLSALAAAAASGGKLPGVGALAAGGGGKKADAPEEDGVGFDLNG
jgi:glycerol-3-phosphate O-acyltransferase 3/4